MLPRHPFSMPYISSQFPPITAWSANRLGFTIYLSREQSNKRKGAIIVLLETQRHKVQAFTSIFFDRVSERCESVMTRSPLKRGPKIEPRPLTSKRTTKRTRTRERLTPGGRRARASYYECTTAVPTNCDKRGRGLGAQERSELLAATSQNLPSRKQRLPACPCALLYALESRKMADNIRRERPLRLPCPFVPSFLPSLLPLSRATRQGRARSVSELGHETTRPKRHGCPEANRRPYCENGTAWVGAVKP